MLPTREWLAAAQALPEGASSRINHICGDGKTLRVVHEATRWRAYCFRCDESGIEDKASESLKERLARLKREQVIDEVLQHTVEPPGPANFDPRTWPVAAQVWLYKAGCGLPEIAKLGAYWHEPSGRVVLPVVQDGRVIYWQARDVSWARKSKRPKYINPTANKTRLVARYGQGDVLVLTEDVLSAFRVGQHTEAWSLMGTSLTDSIAASIPTARTVLVWLDPDRAGIKAARSITKQLTNMGIRTRRIKARADPKLLSDREIYGVLSLSENTPPST